MRSAFRWTGVGGTTREHVTDAATVSAEPDGDTYEVITALGAETVTDVRGIWLVVTVDTSAPGGLDGADGGSGRTLRQVWLDLLGGQAIAWQPDVTAPDVQIAVVPDLRHMAKLYDVRAGGHVPGDVLKLRSRILYAPDSPTVLDLAKASPYSPLTSSIIIGA